MVSSSVSCSRSGVVARIGATATKKVTMTFMMIMIKLLNDDVTSERKGLEEKGKPHMHGLVETISNDDCEKRHTLAVCCLTT